MSHNYAVITNCPMNSGLMIRTSQDKIDWVKYGFTIDGMRLAKQGRNADGDYINILPIINDERFDAQLPAMVKFCEDTVMPNDSIEKVDQAKADELKATIVSNPLTELP